MGRKTTAAQTALKLTRSQLETVIYRWNGVKAFDTNGYYWMSNSTDVVTPTTRNLPLYVFDLTALRENGLATGTVQPFLQMQSGVAGSGGLTFSPRSHILATGATEQAWSIEKSPSATDADVMPMSKSFIKSLSIKMNCWGAKTKAAQYTIQLVKFLDDDLVPSTATVDATPKRNDFYQNLIKTLTFNPIAQTGGSYKGRMKVLKSETFTLQPNSLDDGDTDPNVRTVSMYVAMNRIISYQESAAVQQVVTQLHDTAMYAKQGPGQFLGQTRPKQRVYLLIRCSNYKLDTADSNVDTPSFDLMIRANHQIVK